jgi:hypothetical protein
MLIQKPEFNIGSPIPLLVLPSQACSAFEDDNRSAGSRLPEVLLVKKPTSKSSANQSSNFPRRSGLPNRGGGNSHENEKCMKSDSE